MVTIATLLSGDNDLSMKVMMSMMKETIFEEKRKTADDK
jgi:hypothetical protein